MIQINEIETWENLAEFAGAYQISNQGRVKGKKNNSKILAQRIDRAGYYTVRIYKEGKSHTKYLHRLIAEAFIPNPDNKPEVNHKDGNKLNNSVDNLEWVTHAENMQHAYLNNLIPIECHCKKVIDLTNMKLYKSIKDLGQKNGLNYSTLKNYLNGRRKNNPTRVMYYEDLKKILFQKTYPYLGLSAAFQFWRKFESSVDSYALAS